MSNAALFKFQNVGTYSSLPITGTDTLRIGKRFHVIAEVEDYDATNKAIVLDPIKLIYITDSSLTNRISTENIVKSSKKVSITNGCNIREQPSYEAIAIKWVTTGETFSLIEESGDWYKIEVESNKIGYIPKERAKVIE